MIASFSIMAAELRCLVLGQYLHSVVLSVVVSYGLQERLCMVAEGYSTGVEFGFVWSGSAERAAVVLVLFLIVVVVDLTGLQASREYGGLEPFYANRDVVFKTGRRLCVFCFFFKVE